MNIIRRIFGPIIHKFDPRYPIQLGKNIGIVCEPNNGPGANVKITIFNLEDRDTIITMTASDKLKIKVIDGVASVFRTRNKGIGTYAKDDR